MPTTISALFLLLCVGSGRAQEVPISSLDEGARIRVTDLGGGIQIGTFVSAEGGRVHWLLGRPVTAGAQRPARELPLGSVARLETSIGTQTRYKKTILITSAALAAALGAINALTFESTCQPEETVCGENRATAFVLGGLGGIILGIPVGAAIAANRKRELWVDVTGFRVPPSLLVTSEGRIGLGVTIPLGRQVEPPFTR